MIEERIWKNINREKPADWQWCEYWDEGYEFDGRPNYGVWQPWNSEFSTQAPLVYAGQKETMTYWREAAAGPYKDVS